MELNLQFFDLMLSGQKTVELRRSHPQKDGTRFGKNLYFCKHGYVYGQATIQGTDFHGITSNAGAARYAVYYYEQAGLTAQEALDYLQGAESPAAYYIEKPIRYRHPVPCQESIPRSWCYITPELERRCIAAAADPA